MKPTIPFTHGNILFVFLMSWMVFTNIQVVRAFGFGEPIGARQAGLNGASVAISDFWNIGNNQAGMAGIDKLSIGIAYENQFSISALGLRSLAVIIPVKWGVTGLSMNYFGNSLYHEMKIGLAYARSFGPNFRVGLQMDYLQSGFGEGYGQLHNLTFEMGLQADLTPDLCVGVWVFNPLNVKLASYQTEHIPIIFRLGLAYHFADNLFVTIESEKNTDISTLSLRAAMEYTFKKRFFFRLGLGNQQKIFSMGFGMHWNHFQIDLAARMHSSLGFSPQTSFVYTF